MRFSDLVQKPMSFFNYNLFKESMWPKTLCEKLGRAIACEATSTHSEIKKGTTMQKVAAIRNSNEENCNYWKYYKVSHDLICR